MIILAVLLVWVGVLFGIIGLSHVGTPNLKVWPWFLTGAVLITGALALSYGQV